MTKEQTYGYLSNHGISYEITEHGAVFNMEELSAVDLPYPDFMAKNLFVRDDKHNKFYLITVMGEKRVNLKDFRKKVGTRPLTFASEDELKNLLSLLPGSVTPLGLINDKAHKVEFYLDEEFLSKKVIGVHPCDNTATVWLNPVDLLSLLKSSGAKVNVIKID